MGGTADGAEPAILVNGRLSPGPIPLARPSPYCSIGWSSNPCPVLDTTSGRATSPVSDADRVDTGNLGFLLAKASQHWNELLAEGFAEHGFAEVRPSYGSVLLPLFEADGLRMGQIAERARLSKQTMTTMVRLCERDGLVYRERDAHDARAFRIHLTERATDFRPVAQEILRELDSKVLAKFGERQRSALARALKGVMDI